MRDLKWLAGCKNVASLRSTIHELWIGSGELSHFDVLTLSGSGKHQALCFFRIESEAQERELIASFGASRFGKDLLLVVDLAEQPENSDHDQVNRDDAVHGPGHDQNEDAVDTRFRLKPARWGTLLAAARRVLDLEVGWPRRLVR
jgi:hypothetical protein